MRWWTPARATPSCLSAFSGNWGVEPIDKIALALADGQPVEMDLGQATATIDGDSEARLIAIVLECASKHLSKELLEAHTSKEDATP